MSIKETTLIQAGMIVPYLGGASATAPTGWLYCDGSEKNKIDYPDLYDVIGNPLGAGTYGTASNPVTKFVLPSPMRVLLGWFNAGLGASNVAHVHQTINSNVSIALNSASHTHTYNAPVQNSSNAPNHDHVSNGVLNYANSNVSSSNVSLASGNANLLADDGHAHELTTYLPSSNYNHTHTGTAGTVNATNNHTHNLTSSVTVSSSPPLDTDYPPYILIWHIIKT